mgnify:CR=1 FL=1
MSGISKEPLDRFIKITEAVTSYNLPHVTRKRVLLSDVQKLRESAQNDNTDAKDGKKNIKRGRGRPRKFG